MRPTLPEPYNYSFAIIDIENAYIDAMFSCHVTSDLSNCNRKKRRSKEKQTTVISSYKLPQERAAVNGRFCLSHF